MYHLLMRFWDWLNRTHEPPRDIRWMDRDGAEDW